MVFGNVKVHWGLITYTTFYKLFADKASECGRDF